jgi:hypothetical protein
MQDALKLKASLDGYQPCPSAATLHAAVTTYALTKFKIPENEGQKNTRI